MSVFAPLSPSAHTSLDALFRSTVLRAHARCNDKVDRHFTPPPALARRVGDFRPPLPGPRRPARRPANRARAMKISPCAVLCACISSRGRCQQARRGARHRLQQRQPLLRFPVASALAWAQDKCTGYCTCIRVRINASVSRAHI